MQGAGEVPRECVGEVYWGALIFAAGGAIMGYFWNDWSTDRTHALYRDNEFLDATSMSSGAPHSVRFATPVTPDATSGNL